MPPQTQISLPVHDPEFVIDPPAPAEPELRAVYDNVLHRLRFAAASVAAETDPGVPDDVDDVFRRYVATRPSGARAAALQTARNLLATPAERKKVLGHMAAIDPARFRTAGSSRIAAEAPKPQFAPGAFKPILQKIRQQAIAQGLGPAMQDMVAGQKYNYLRLHLQSVKCETDTDEISPDEIFIGGTKTNPEGETAVVGPYLIRRSFTEGMVAHPLEHPLTPGSQEPKTFARFKLRTEPGGFPYVYTFVLALVEEDHGGIHQFLKDLWKVVDKEVTTAIGTAVGGAIGSVFPGIGTLVGMLVGAIVGALVGWFIDLFKDDVLGIRVVQIRLSKTTASYYRKRKLLPEQDGKRDTLHYHGHESHYKVAFRLGVFAE